MVVLQGMHEAVEVEVACGCFPALVHHRAPFLLRGVHAQCALLLQLVATGPQRNLDDTTCVQQRVFAPPEQSTATRCSYLAELLKECGFVLQRVLSLQGIDCSVHGVQAGRVAKQYSARAGGCCCQAANVGRGDKCAAEVTEAVLHPFHNASAVGHERLEWVVGGDGWVEAHCQHIVEDIGAEPVFAANVKESVETIDIVCK